MRNIKMEVKGTILTLTIDLSQTFGRSKSGKTTIIASTDGNVNVQGSDAKLGVNVYK
jgi:hypothetical protein